MTIEKVNHPFLTIGHLLTTVAMFAGVLAYANDTENKVVVTETQQKAIIQNQADIKKDFKAYQREQQQIQMQQMQLLHEIKGRLKNSHN